MGRRWKGPTIEWSYAWKETYNILPRSSWGFSYCIKSGRMSGMLVSGNNFPSPSEYCLTTLITFKIPNITWDVGHSFNMYVGFQGPGWLYVLGIPPRADLRLWTPRARATDIDQGPNLRAESGRDPCVPRSREYEERPAAVREKNADGPKKHVYILRSIYIFKGSFAAADWCPPWLRSCSQLPRMYYNRQIEAVNATVLPRGT